MQTKDKSLVTIPAIISAISLFIAIPPGLPYGFYILLRVIVFVCAIFCAVKAKQIQKTNWVWIMGFIVLLFNPIVPFPFGKEIWSVVDFIIAVIFVVSIFKLKIKKEIQEKNVFNNSFTNEVMTEYYEEIAEYFVIRGKECEARDAIREAIYCYEKALEIDPKNERALFHLGNCYLKSASQEQVSVFDLDEKPFEENPNAEIVSLEQLDELDKAELELDLSDFIEKNWIKKAIPIFQKLIEIKSNTCPQYLLYSKLAFAQSIAGMYKESIQNYTKSIKLNPSSADYEGRGDIYKTLDEHQKAIDDYTNAIELHPKDPFGTFYYKRGTIYEKIEEYQKAIDNYTKAIEINPQKSLYYFSRGSVYEKIGKLQEASNDFNQEKLLVNKMEEKLKNSNKNETIQLKPVNAKIYKPFFEYGVNYIKLGDYQKAIDEFSRAIGLNSEYTDAYFHRGFSHYLLGDYQKAVDDYTKALELNSERADIYCSRGMSYAILKEHQRAIKDFAKAIELDSNFFIAYCERGFGYYNLGEYQKAMEDYNFAIKINPKDARVYYRRGWVFSNLEQYQKAIEDFTCAINLEPEYGDAYGARATAYAKIEEYQKAGEDGLKAGSFISKKYPFIQDLLKKEEDNT